MKRIAAFLSLGLMWGAAGMAGINIPSDGSDGQLYVVANTTIDLSRAVTGNWASNNTANAGKGIYDPDKWAVVFKYTNIYVAAGATVTFSNHPSRAPVVWLVNGNVRVDGTVSLDGQNGREAPDVAEPAPGGFRGGIGQHGIAGGAGFGVGGGAWTQNGVTYANASLLPLIGGSGGGGGQYGGGGGGGGAILIACSQNLLVSGVIRACGRDGVWQAGAGGGGCIRLVAENFNGNGVITTVASSTGKIRIERVAGSGTQAITPTPSLVALDPGATPLIWLPDSGPTARIVSIGSIPAPVDPRGGVGKVPADIQLIETNSVPLIVETRNAEQTSQVIVRVNPLAGANCSTVNASLQQVVSTDPLVILWRANVPVQLGHSAMQVRVVRP